jgi:hypothetical protein
MDCIAVNNLRYLSGLTLGLWSNLASKKNGLQQLQKPWLPSLIVMEVKTGCELKTTTGKNIYCYCFGFGV